MCIIYIRRHGTAVQEGLVSISGCSWSWLCYWINSMRYFCFNGIISIVIGIPSPAIGRGVFGAGSGFRVE